MTRQKTQAIYGAMYILPSLILMIIFTFIPIGMTIYFSFTKYNLVQAPQWIGLENYQKLLTNSYLRQALLNTVQYVLVTVPAQTILSLVIASFLAGRLRNKLGETIRGMMFIPHIASMIACAAVWSAIYDTNGGMLNQFLQAIGAFGIFLMRQFMEAVPNDLLEAAEIDGSGELRTFFTIVLPLVQPALITLTVFTFTSSWNNFLWPLIITNKSEMFTLTLTMSTLSGRNDTNYGLVMAGATLTFLFPFILYLFMQKQFVEGIALGGVKG